MIKFEYFEPKTSKEAAKLLATYKNSARIISGGTDLLVRMKKREWLPKAVINIKKINTLHKIKSLNKTISIGANITLSEIIESKIIEKHFPILKDAALKMASDEIRNIATVVGNLCNASPAADMATPLLCLDAILIAQNPGGTRKIKITDFFTGPGKTSLKKDEVVTHILLSKKPALRKFVFLKHTTRNALDIAIVNLSLIKSDRIKIALGAVAPVPFRAFKTEDFVNENELSEMTIAKAAEIAVSECKPIDDIRASAWYRKEIIKHFVKTALESLICQK